MQTPPDPGSPVYLLFTLPFFFGALIWLYNQTRPRVIIRGPQGGIHSEFKIRPGGIDDMINNYGDQDVLTQISNFQEMLPLCSITEESASKIFDKSKLRGESSGKENPVGESSKKMNPNGESSEKANPIGESSEKANPEGESSEKRESE